MKTRDKIYLIIFAVLVILFANLDSQLQAEEDKQSLEVCKLQDTEYPTLKSE